MAGTDPNEDASGEVKKVTGEASFMSGAELLKSPKSRAEFQNAKQQEIESLKEDVFRAWRDWDCEVNDVAAMEAAKKKVEAGIDRYYKATGSGAARWAFFLYFRDEYADWRIENDD